MRPQDEKSKLRAYIQEHKQRRRWYKLTACLAAVAVLVTAGAMVLPAITLENSPEILECQLDLHTHTDDCYDQAGNLICGQADFVVHTHTDACYGADGTLICPLEEIQTHTHGDACYQETRVLVCGQAEAEGHVHDASCYPTSQEPLCGLEETAPHTHQGHIHTEACYAEVPVLICGQEESEGHTHTAACYETRSSLICTQDTGCYDEAGNLVCGLEETEGHTHTAACYQTPEEPLCGLEETSGHVHTDACYQVQRELVCDQQEIILHTHTDSCYDQAGNLICGLLEVKEHVHDESCFSEEDAQTLQPYTLQTRNTPGSVDFTDMITKIITQVQQGGYWTDLIGGTVEEGSPLRVRIEFTIRGGTLSGDNRTIHYQLPDGVHLNEEEHGEVAYNAGGPAGAYTIGTDGYVEITFYDDFPVDQDFSGYLQFEGSASLVPGQDETVIDFGGVGGSITVVPEVKELDLTIAKQGTYDRTAGQVNYTVIISSENGTNGNPINMGDWFQHDVSYGSIVYDQESLSIQKITADGQTTPVTPSPNDIILHQQDDTGPSWFTVENLPALAAGESYQITYAAIPDLEHSGDSNGYLEFLNVAGAYSGGKTVNSYAKVILSQARLEKTLVNYNQYERTVTWTINVRNPEGLDLAGKQLTDLMAFMPKGGNDWTWEAAPSGITLTVKEYAAADVNFNTPLNTYTYENVTFPMTFPTGSTGGYTLTYTTTLPEELAGQTGYFNNYVRFLDYEANAGLELQIPGEIDYAVIKDFWNKTENVETSDKNIVTALTWGIMVTYPQGATGDDLLFVDLIADAKKQDGTVIPGSHYTTAEALAGDGLLVTNSAWTTALTLGTDYNIYVVFKDQQPASITPENFQSVSYDELKRLPWSDQISSLSQPISMIAVALTESGLQKLDGQAMVIQYRTVLDTDELPAGSTLTATNQARIPQAWDDASYEERFLERLDKQVSSTGPDDTLNVSSYGDAPASTIDPNGLIYYRLLLTDFLADGTGGLTVTDTLPAGAKLVEDQVYLAFHDQAAETINPSYLFQAPHYYIQYSTAAGEGGTTTITFTLSHLTDYKDADALGIYYVVSVADDPVWDTSSSKDYTNTAIWGTYTDSITTTVSQTLPALKKTGEQLFLDDGSPSNQVRYYVVINPDGSQLLEEPGGTLTLTDTLTVPEGSAAQLLLETAQVCRYDPAKAHGIGTPLEAEEYSIRYDGETYTLTVEVPDATACVVVYDYQIDRGQSDMVSLTLDNQAELQGIALTNSDFEIEIKEQSSSAGVNTANLILYKVSSENNAELLNGALFKLERFDLVGGQYIWEQTSITAKGPDGLFVTGGDGPKGEIILNFLGGENQTRYETIYRIREHQAPDGYQITDNSYHYFVWMREGATKDTTIRNMSAMLQAAGINSNDVVFIPYNANYSLYVENEPTTTSIQVEKYWQSPSGEPMTEDLPEQITVTLYQTVNGETTRYVPTDGQENPATIALDPDTGDWTYTWTGLPKADAQGNACTYTVEETTVPGFTTAYTNNAGIQAGTIEITNTKTTSYVLPETGGIGPAAPVIAGLLLVGASGTGIQYLRRRRRRGGNSS